MLRPFAIRFWSAALLTVAVILVWTPGAFPQPPQGPRLWQDSLRSVWDGIKLRQGYFIEWQRASYRRSDGYTLVAWSDCRTGDRDVYAQLISPSGQEMWPQGGRTIVTYPYRQEDPEVVSVNGGWIVAWIDFRYDSSGDVFAQKLNDAGTKLWADTTGMIVDTFSCHTTGCGSAVNQTTLRAVHDGNGGAIIAWEDTRHNDPGDIFAQRIRSDGTRGWDNGSDSVLTVTLADGGQTAITADNDGSGNMLVAWQDQRSQELDIYAAKVTPSRQLPWGGINGELVCGAPFPQTAPKLCPDGQGGCYIAWVDQRNHDSAPTTPQDLYIQRLDGNGVALWESGGIPLCNDSTGNQDEVRIAVSQNGVTQDGCIAVWEDLRANGQRNEVYAQKILPQGTMAWEANGLKVCGDAGHDTLGPTGNTRDGSRLVSDFAGGLICAWEDTRNSDNDPQNCDLYGARVSSDGSILWGGQCGELLANGAHKQNQPLIRGDAGTGVFVFYDDYGRGSQSINYHRFDIATGNRIATVDSILVFGLEGDALAPMSVAMNPGRVGVVWQDNRAVSGGTAIFYQVVDSSGHYERTANGDTLVPDNSGYSAVSQVNQQVCSDGNGGFFVTFEDLRTGANRIRLTRVNNLGNLACSRAADVVWADGQTTDQVRAYCAPDGLGGCYVAWSNFDQSYLIDAYVMRMNSDCTPAWPQPVRLTNTPDDDMMYGVTSNPDHSCIMTWQSGDYGAYNVSTARVRDDGSVAWHFNVCDAHDEQVNPTVVADGHGGAFYAWSDKRNNDSLPGFDHDIYAQHLDSTAHELWQGHNGIPVVIDTLLQDRPSLSVAADGNVFCVWQSFIARPADTSSDLNLVAQKLTPGGVRLWPALGKPLCLARGDQNEQVLCPDPGGGLWTAWTDYRVIFPDVYGMHWLADGTPANNWWKPDSGGVITGAYQWQWNSCIAPDGSGGVFSFWVDQRASGKEPLKNIWMQRVNDGPLRARNVSAAIPTKPELYQNYPNPFNPSTRISFYVPGTMHVTVEIYNLLGERVATLVDRVMSAGKYEVAYESPRLASGMYYYRMKAPNFVSVKKMLLLK